MADLLTVHKGTTWEQGWPVVRWDDQGMPHGVSITGYAIKAQVRLRAGSPTVLHEWSDVLGNARIDTIDVDVWDLSSRAKYTVTTDVIVLHLDPADSLAWTWSCGVWDLMTRAPGEGGWVDWISEGSIEAKETVTVL